MDEQVAIAEPYHGHACRKRHTQGPWPKVDERTVYDPEILGDRSESVQWLVCIATQDSAPTADQLGHLAARPQQLGPTSSDRSERGAGNRLGLGPIEDLRVDLEVGQSLLGDHERLGDSRYPAKARR